MGVKQLRIHGQVQGVGFRWSMARQAQALAITGWVRNRVDGTVEAVVCGDDAALAAIVDWAYRGPAGAWVSRVDIAEDTGDFVSFEQRPTV